MVLLLILRALSSPAQCLSCSEKGLSKVLLGAWTQKHLVLSRLKFTAAFSSLVLAGGLSDRLVAVSAAHSALNPLMPASRQLEPRSVGLQ